MKKIVYIHPQTTELRDSQFVIPIGMVNMSNIIKKLNVDYLAIDIPLEKSIDPNFDIEEELIKIKPDIVLIDLHWMIYSYSSIQMCHLCKKINKNIITILGGITSSIYYEEILRNYSCVNYIVVGYAENIIQNFINNLINEKTVDNISNIAYFANDNVIINKNDLPNIECKFYLYSDYDFLKNHNKLFFKQANHKGIPISAALAWIPTGRGCSYNCSYCGGNKNMFKKVFCQNKMISYDANDVVDCMEKLHEKYNVNTFGITHDFWIFGKNYYETIINKINNMSFKPGIYNYLFQMPSIEYLGKYIKVINEECSIVGLPVVCGDEKDRFLNGKYFKNKEIFDFLNIFIGTQIKIELYFIANPLYGTSNFDKTISFVRKILKKYNKLLNLEISCGFEIIQPYSLKQVNNKSVLNSFKDFYYRYSPEFLIDIKNGRNIEYLVGESKYNKKLYNNLNKIKEVINEYEKS
jgi:radical SAM superfamily enzyme YgiQ (UPF0313 family)